MAMETYSWRWSIGSILIIYIHMFTGYIMVIQERKRANLAVWNAPVGYFLQRLFSGYMLPWGQMSYWAGMVLQTYSLGVHFMLMG